MLRIALILCAAATGLPAQPPAPQMSEVKVSVFYRERMALPAGARIEVSLNDVSRADAPAREISRVHRVTTGNQPPYEFSLPYDASKIDERMSYAVSARILVEGKLIYASDTRTPVITRGGPKEVKLMVVRTGSGKQ